MMPDITMCKAKDCPLQSVCERHTNNTQSNPLHQAYFIDPPVDTDTGKCEYLLDYTSQSEKQSQ